MLNIDMIDETLDNLSFFDERLKFIHPDEMIRYMDELSIIPGIKARKIGSSREKRDIFAVEIGTGGKVIFAVGGAHADEPTGTVTLLNLAREFGKIQKIGYDDEYKFIFIPQLDPDGAARNWQWMKDQPYSYGKFTQFNYRNNNPENDVEHGIPILEEQSMRPEVAAFKTYIDRIGRIDYYITLHTTHLLGGAIFVMCAPALDPVKPVIDFLVDKCHKNGLAMMDIELYGQHGMERIAPGFITAPRVEDFQKYYKDHPEVLKMLKMNTYQYAMEKRGARLSLISELPFLVDPELNNTEETRISRYDLEMEIIRRSENLMRERERVWNKLKNFPHTAESRFWATHYEFILEMGPKAIAAQRADAPRYKDKYAKMYELKDLDTEKFIAQYTIGLMGMRRLSGLKTKEAVAAYAEYERMFNQGWTEYEKRISYWLLPLSRQVKLQTAMILAGLLVV